MPLHVSPSTLSALQHRPLSVRNICVLAHVDHGKTTLSDSLLAANSLVHPRLAGKVRILDWREDEQQRGVTMKSSSVALLHRKKGGGGEGEGEGEDFLVNLIDSPGHVDFCSEVSTAARLSDGALVLVDVCEGVHIQTHAVLRQAWEERVKPTLVLNKVDRLVVELRLTPTEAYERMKTIIAEVNNIINGFRSEKYISDVDSVLAGSDTKKFIEDEEEKDEEDEFVPQKGNVAFACAIDGWAFRIGQFAKIYASKLGASEAVLKKALWGDHYFVPKTKKIVGKKASGGKLKPMFAQFILEPVWQVYNAVFEYAGNSETLHKLIKAMNLTIPPRELSHKDPKSVLQSVMSRWLPLSEAVMDMVVECLPNPICAQKERINRFLPKEINVVSEYGFENAKHLQTDDSSREEWEATEEKKGRNESLLYGELDKDRDENRVNGERTLKMIKERVTEAERAVEFCDGSENVPCVVFVSKMVAVPIEWIPKKGPNGEYLNLSLEEITGDTDASNRECFLGFARVFSGVLREGQKMFVLSELYDPYDATSGERYCQEVVIKGLYMMMGQGLEPMTTVPAGNCTAIRGLGLAVLKNATLASTPFSRPFASMLFQAAPIVRVAVEPEDPADLAALTRGLRLLHRADPFVELQVSGSGESVVSAAGEVHLERCIKDLQDRFAKVKLVVSPPLVAFRETIKSSEEVGSETSQKKVFPLNFTESVTPDGRCRVRVRVTRLPNSITRILDDNVDIIKALMVEGKVALTGSRRKNTNGDKNENNDNSFENSRNDPVSVLRKRLISAIEGEEEGVLDSEKSEVWKQYLTKIWSLGPRHSGSNLLILEDFKSEIKGLKEGGGEVKGEEGEHEKKEDGGRVDFPTVTCKGIPMGSIKLGLAAAPQNLNKEVGERRELASETGEGGEREEGLNHGLQNMRETQETSKEETENQTERGDKRGEEMNEQEDNVMRELEEEAESLSGSVVSGFQLATLAGSLCEEPLWGLGFCIEASIAPRGHGFKSTGEAPGGGLGRHGSLSGQVMAAVREACRSAVSGAGARMAEALYFCEVSTHAEALGSVYAVLSRRRAQILREEMREGAASFTVHSLLPVSESFGFADELRRKTSGAASPQLVLSHWVAMEEDPFFVPRTEEELEEYGDGIGLARNTARKLMDAVRRRKGLAVEEKIVESGTKNRTRARKV